MKKILTFLLGVSLLPLTGHAEQFWSDNSLSVLYGGNYKMIPYGKDSEAGTMTLEHVSGHSWGGVFLFVDRIRTKDDPYTETYGEFSPSFYLKKFDDSFVKSVNAEFTYEFGASAGMNQDNVLAGIGFDLDIPGMDFFKATVYHAWDQSDSFGRSQDDQLTRSEEHTSELQSRPHLVCRLLLEKKNKQSSTLLRPAALQHFEPCPHASRHQHRAGVFGGATGVQSEILVDVGRGHGSASV